MRLYLIAMLDEAKDLVNEFEIIQEKPFLLYKKRNEILAITGVGKVNSSFVTSFMISSYNIKEIINIGFAGAYGNFKIGDVVFVSKALYHDVDATAFGYKSGQIPQMPEYYEPKDYMKNLFIDYKKSTLLTGDYFVTKNIGDNYIADMEGAAIFQVGYRMNIPTISIKIVSDLINSEDHLSKYNKFEKIGSKNIRELYLRLEALLNG